MAEFEALLKTYDWKTSLAVECGDGCVALDVDQQDFKDSADPLERLRKQIEDLLLMQSQYVQKAPKLYVYGKWESRSEDWVQGVQSICGLIQHMKDLEELTWVSELPFLGNVWQVLPKTLKKLAVDVGRPVKIDSTDSQRASYISQDAMKPLVTFVDLRELRLLGMRDSFQSIIWETVFRNKQKDGGMRILDLQMAAAAAPLIRQKQWIEGKNVEGLHVPTDSPEGYKGLDGKGILHHAYGTGEYLDDYCMRKARISSALDEASILPLWCLKLDGFVVDRLPFEQELSRVVLLTCGEKCVDAGLRAPKTNLANTWNKWGSYVEEETTHCLIAWPSWGALFDNEGRLLKAHERNIPKIGNTFEALIASDPAPLTEEHLSVKTVKEALLGYESERSQFGLYAMSEGAPDWLSVVTTRGSPVPSPSTQSAEEANEGSNDTTEGFDNV